MRFRPVFFMSLAVIYGKANPGKVKNARTNEII